VATFDADDLRTLDQTYEVRIEPLRPDGTSARRKIIWLVVDGDQAYVRSVRGAAGGWYRAVRRSGTALLHLLHAGDSTWRVQLESVTDAAEIERVSDALRRKYGHRSKQSTAMMLQDEAVSATLRLSPAE
jgi:hypothetical protein